MADKTWKSVERKVAAWLGGVRVPVTGRARGDQPDIHHPVWSIEVKHRKNPPALLRDAMDQAKKSSRGGRVPLVVVVPKHRPLREAFVVLRLGDFADWYGEGTDVGGDAA